MSDPTPTPVPPPNLSGRTLGDFQLLRKLGQGGMGQVYLARQVSLKREVAVKILRDDHATNPTALKRFQAEAEAVARISHPNIVQVYAVGEHDGLRYMALEYVAGRNLREFLDRKGPPGLPVALAVLRQVAAALQRAAELGLVHRDIKPENILLTRKAEVKVADFGLSRYFAGDGQPLSLTQSGMTLGTPLYMSPEQVQGRAVDHRSDLYSFGVTAYHLLAGFPPFTGGTAFEVAAQHVQRQAEPLHAHRPDLPPDLCAVVHKLMAKNPDDRYAAAKEVIRDLGKIQKGLAVGASASTPTATALIPIPPLNVSLSGVGVPSVAAPSNQLPVAAAGGTRRLGRAAGVTVAVLAAGGGWLAYGLAYPKADARTPITSPGLPSARPPNPLVSPREATLLEQLKATPPADRKHLEAGLHLGLLYVAERRLDDAERVFKELDAGPPVKPKDSPLPVAAGVLSRLGQAVVLAHRDKPDESNRMFADAVSGVTPRAAMRPAVERLCFEYPAVGQAVSEAVSRNADAQPKDAKLPPLVEWLRNPSSLLRGPR